MVPTMSPDAQSPAASTDAGRSVAPPGEGGSESESPRIGLALLGVGMVLGLLRFFRLGEWSLWFDEVLTWGDSHLAPDGLLNRAGYWLIRQSVEWTGSEPTEFSLRLLPALAGYLAVPLSFWAFRPLAGSTRAGMAAILIAASAWELQWSQTARFYTFVQLTSLIGAGVTIRGLLSSRSVLVVAGVLLAASGVMFHLQAGLVALALLVAALLAPPSQGPGARAAGRRAALALLLPVLVGAPVLYRSWATYQGMKAVSDPVGSAAHFLLSVGWYVTPALGAAAVAAVILAVRSGDRRCRFVMIVAALGTGALLGLSMVATVSAQYFFSFFPFVALVAAWPLGSPGLSRTPWARNALAVGLILPQVAGAGLYLTSERGQRPRWREAAEYVAAHREPGDSVASDPAAVVEFYLGDRDPRWVRRTRDVVSFDQFNPWFVRSEVKKGGAVWLVLRNDNLMRYDAELRTRFLSYVADNFQLVQRFPVLVAGRDLSIDVWHHR